MNLHLRGLRVSTPWIVRSFALRAMVTFTPSSCQSASTDCRRPSRVSLKAWHTVIWRSLPPHVHTLPEMLFEDMFHVSPWVFIAVKYKHFYEQNSQLRTDSDREERLSPSFQQAGEEKREEERRGGEGLRRREERRGVEERRGEERMSGEERRGVGE